MKKQFLLFLVTSLLGVASFTSAHAADRYWACGSSWWDFTCWSATSGGAATLGQPQNGDNVFLTQSDAANRTVSYYNTLYPSAVLGQLRIDATGTGTMTLSQTSFNHPLASSYEYVGYSGTGSHVQSTGSNTISDTLYLGYASGSNGIYNLSGIGSLTANFESVGHSGTGSFTQSGGMNTVSDTLFLGYGSGSSGTYTLSGTGKLSAFGEYIGYSGTGVFTQSGGAHTVISDLFLGYGSTGIGTYNLSNTGSLSAINEYIGDFGTGSFTQSGGTHTVANDLYLGNTSTGNGTYHLSNTGSLSAGSEFVGYSGTGSFTQSGGTNTVSNTLYLGHFTGSNGSYNLNSGTLNVGAIVNGSGTGTFNLDGGTLNVTGSSIAVDTFNVGNASGSNASFTLGSGKTLIAGFESIGNSGTGVFTQSGGTHTVSGGLSLGSNSTGNGTYNLNGGTLNVGPIVNGSGTGTFNLNGGTLNVGIIVNGLGTGTFILNGGTLNLTGSSINVDTFRIGNASGSNASFTLGSGKTLIAGFESIGNSGTGVFTQTGGTHTVSSNLTLGVNSGSSGTYNLRAGTLTVNGNILDGSGTGILNIDGGTLSVGGGNGSINLDALILGSVTGTGSFTQNGGTNTLGNLTLGLNPGSNGIYALNAGGMSTFINAVIGNAGTGSFTQTGGTHTVNGDLVLGGYRSFDFGVFGNGTYILSGTGSLMANSEFIGYSGIGVFTQTGGTHTVNGDLILGGYRSFDFGVFGDGTYNLSAGNLTAGYEIIGDFGTGTFTQSSGSHTVANNLYLGNTSLGNGTYNLSAGSLSASSETIGYSGTGSFTQTGGTHTVSSITLGLNTGSNGTYNLDGGMLNVGNILNGSGTDTFNLDGGTLNLTGSVIGVDTFRVGNASGSNGNFILGGGKALAVSSEFIGVSGTGSLTQTGGMHTVAGSLNMGTNGGSSGTYNLNGGTLNVGGNIVNGAGTSTFNLDGGTLSVGGGNGSINVDNFVLGSASGKSGSHTLSGSGSLTATHEIFGQGGAGHFTQNSGTNTLTGNLTLGFNPGSNGTYAMNSGSVSTLNAFIGNSGIGVFTQTGGAHTVINNLTFGVNSGSSGTYNLRAGTLTVNGSILNGPGTGTLNIDGGSLSVAGGSMAVDTLVLGSTTGSSGIHTLGTGSLSADIERIGPNGSGSFTQTGGTHTVSNTLTIATNNPGSSGTYNLQGGTLTVNNGIINNGSLRVGAGATATVGGPGLTNNASLTGSGTIQGDVISAGLVTPGNSPGTLTIDGDYTQSGTLAIEISGLLAGSEYDVLNVSGTASLGGSLNVSLFDLGGGLFAPNAGDSFDILTADLLQGSFGTLSFAALLDPNLKWHISYLTDAIGATDVVRLSVVNAVPVPPAVWLFGSGLLGLAGVARRKARHGA
jgi:hypothetical protein